MATHLKKSPLYEELDHRETYRRLRRYIVLSARDLGENTNDSGTGPRERVCMVGRPANMAIFDLISRSRALASACSGPG